ncbi:MAG TPA: transporter associated domain-containing protein [Gammaproteobacteria bacterium]|nr:transporter associated domain-containing protein [Gammaproteobacteria bacterium]
MKNNSLLTKIIAFITRDTYTKKGLEKYLEKLITKNILDQEDVSLIHGCLQMSALKVRDVMTPRAQIIALQKDSDVPTILSIIQSSRHSRFPVIDKGFNDVSGILLAKQLFEHIDKLTLTPTLDIEKHLIKTIFVPESKRLDNLLRELRASHNHMAIVIDEYGSVSGLITIEDIIEQIVGDIEDEHYEANDEDIILSSDGLHYIVKASTSIEDFNAYFKTSYSDSYFDTLGGLIAREFGHIPKENESLAFNKFEFKTIKASSRSIELLQVTKIELK